MAKYNRALAEQIASLVAEGVPAKYAAAACGIGESTYHEWRAKHLEFSELLEQKRAEAVRGRVDIIQQAAEGGTWQAAAWWLERQCPDEFAMRPRAVAVQAGGATLSYEQRLALVTSGLSESAGRVGDLVNTLPGVDERESPIKVIGSEELLEQYDLHGTRAKQPGGR